MTIDKTTYDSKWVVDKLLSNLTLCHNILRNQEGMTPESAFRELNKLLFVKFLYEKNDDKHLIAYEDDFIHQVFNEVKQEFEHEHLFEFNETINTRPTSYRDVFGVLDSFFYYTNADTGRAYENFVQKVLRSISSEPVIPQSIAEFIADYFNISKGSNIIDPFCGYGGLLSEIVCRRPIVSNGKIMGYEKDQMLAQTAKINLLMHGDKESRIERDRENCYYYEHQFDFVITCIKHRENIREDIMKALDLMGPKGKAGIIVPDDILQKDQYEDIRRMLLSRYCIKAIISLPSSAIKQMGRVLKTSILIINQGYQAPDTETMLAKIEHVGVSSLGLPSDKNDFKVIQPSVYQWLQEGRKQVGKQVMWVHLSDLSGWNVEAEFLREENRFMTQYPLYKLGDIAEIAIAEDLNKDEYMQLTVRKKQHDVTLRGWVSAKDINNKKRQMVVHAGQMLISRIDAKDGAIGIVPKELDGAIVSDNFIVLNIVNSQVAPYYLLMVLTSERYKKMLKGISRGMTTRSYIKNVDLLNLEIPIPTMEKQKKLIANLEGLLNHIKLLEIQWAEGINRFSNELFGL